LNNGGGRPCLRKSAYASQTVGSDGINSLHCPGNCGRNSGKPSLLGLSGHNHSMKPTATPHLGAVSFWSPSNHPGRNPHDRAERRMIVRGRYPSRAHGFVSISGRSENLSHCVSSRGRHFSAALNLRNRGTSSRLIIVTLSKYALNHLLSVGTAFNRRRRPGYTSDAYYRVPSVPQLL
jgi:hypothetical protein